MDEVLAVPSWGLMVPEGTLSDSPQSRSQVHSFLPLPCSHTNHPTSRMPGHIGRSPNAPLNAPSPDLGSEEKRDPGAVNSPCLSANRILDPKWTLVQPQANLSPRGGQHSWKE